MKTALAQINPRIGDLVGNRKKAFAFLEKARGLGANLIVFPELSVTGYPPRDLLDFASFVESNERIVQELARAAQGITAICGFVERNPTPTGKAFFNSAAAVRDGKILACYRKQLLPYYDVFEDERYFEPGPPTPCTIDVEGKRVALSICEDLWNDSPALVRPYATRPIEQIAKAQADCVINLSASPFHLGKPELRERIVSNVSAQLGCPVLLCNQIGGNDELLFDGASIIFNGKGELIGRAKSFEEELFLFDFSTPHPNLSQGPMSEAEWLIRALAMGIRDYVHKCGVGRVCLGLSGGVDSSVVAALAVKALGPDAVSALYLPSRFSSPQSRDNAFQLAHTLGIACHEISIEPWRTQFAPLWKAAFGKEPKGLTAENIQPRLRMSLLMALANEQGSLLLNTSNKSELATGYSTLYGDTAGALAVLGDLTKRQVYAIAQALNEERETIPRHVLERPPTAELRENQTDQDTLPPYDTLDAIVTRSVEHCQTQHVLKDHFPAKHVETYTCLYAGSEYKRRQFPPVLRVSPRAFGMGRRVPVASCKPWGS